MDLDSDDIARLRRFFSVDEIDLTTTTNGDVLVRARRGARVAETRVPAARIRAETFPDALATVAVRELAARLDRGDI